MGLILGIVNLRSSMLSEMQVPEIYFGIIFALFGVLGCADLVQKKKKCTEETTAIVTEISKEIDNDNNLSYWPIIEYNINGKKFKNKLLSGNSIFQKYNIGNEVEIFYNKENGG